MICYILKLFIGYLECKFQLTFTIQISSSHNITPVKDKQILLIDVYTKWTGPCIAVESYLRRIRHAFVEAPDSLVLARACCDNIDELEAFKQ